MLAVIPIPFGISVIKKVFVFGVDGAGLVGVFDRAPVLFAAGSNFRDIEKKAVHVAAVDTVDLLDQVEVAQVLAVDDDVVAAFDLVDLVDGETGPLIEGDEKIQQQARDDKGVDHRRSQEVPGRCMEEIFKETLYLFFMFGDNLLLKVDPVFSDRIGELFLAAGKFLAQFVFQVFDLFQDFIDSFIHYVALRV